MDPAPFQPSVIRQTVTTWSARAFLLLVIVQPSMRRPDAESADQDVLGIHLVSLHVGKSTPCSLGLSSPGTAPFALFSHDIPTPGTLGVVPLRLLAEAQDDWGPIPPVGFSGLPDLAMRLTLQGVCQVLWHSLTKSAQGENAVVLQAEITTLLGKGAIDPIPSAKMKKGFVSPYFIVPRKSGGLNLRSE
ncbi:hypothetical protein M9458_054015, partial [Cirrhinus mrigala]